MLRTLGNALAFGLVLKDMVTASSLVERQGGVACSQLHLMIAGGCQLPCTEDTPGLLDTLLAKITAAYPGSDQYFVPYDGSTYQGQVSTVLMIEAAKEYAATCPNTPIVFVGYSLGGIITMNTICGGIPELVPNVLAAITYGEETYSYPQSYDAGTCTRSAPLYQRNNTAECQPFAAAIQDYCDSGDPQCCGDYYNPSAHFAYPGLYDNAALAFIQKRYAALGLKYTPSSTTSSILAPITISSMMPASSGMSSFPTAKGPFYNVSTATTTSGAPIVTLPTSGASSVILPSTGLTTLTTTSTPVSTITVTGLSTVTIPGGSTITVTGASTIVVTGVPSTLTVVQQSTSAQQITYTPSSELTPQSATVMIPSLIPLSAVVNPPSVASTGFLGTSTLAPFVNAAPRAPVPVLPLFAFLAGLAYLIV